MEASPPSANKRHLSWRSLVRIILVLGVIGGGVITFLAGLVVREGMRASAVMKAQSTKNSVLRLLTPKESAESRSATQAVALPTTSATLTQANTKGRLNKFEPLIPDAADLPEKLRKDRAAINIQFAQCLEHIQRYENAKARLTPEQARAEINQITRERNQVYSAVLDRAHHLALPTLGESSLGRIQARLEEVVWWFKETSIDMHERQENWMGAGITAESYLNARLLDWRKRKGDSASYNQFFQEYGEYEYHRAIHCFWKSGGLFGYANLLDVSLSHYYEKLGEAWRKPAQNTLQPRNTQNTRK